MYIKHYTALLRYAFHFVEDIAIAEEIVHQVFLKILEKGEAFVIRSSIKAYLSRAVYHECLNYLKHEKVKREFSDEIIKTGNGLGEPSSQKSHYNELEKMVSKAINELPEQCRTIFQLSRFEGLKYAEIAKSLGLSVKTVETQMSRALKKLRVQLADYLPVLLWIIIKFSFKV